MSEQPHGELVVILLDRDGASVSTGLMGQWTGDAFIVPFDSATTAEEVGRIVTAQIRNLREIGEGDSYER